jgi:hypothetical protein
MSDTISITGDSNEYRRDWRLESVHDSQRVDRLITGQVGCSGGTDSQDELVCKAGVTVISCGLAPQYDLRSLSLGRVRSQILADMFRKSVVMFYIFCTKEVCMSQKASAVKRAQIEGSR